MKWKIPEGESKIRILPAKEMHTHTFYNKVDKNINYLQCTGATCPLCKLAEQFKKKRSLFRRIIDWFKRLLK